MTILDYMLSEGEPWLQYCVRVNLLHEDKNSLVELKESALQDSKIRAYLEGVADFHGVLVSNHKNPDLPIHKLLFLLDIGFDISVPEINTAIGEIMMHIDANGVYQSRTNIPKHYGGLSEDVFGWCLCDSPLLLLALIKAGISYEDHIKQGLDYLASLSQPNGFSCIVSAEHGKFRGPGRKDDCCPYATLAMLQAFAEIPEYQHSESAQNSMNAILSLWENSREKHPYMFYMGTDFRKLKAPAMWYDVVSVVDCLSKFAFSKQDSRFHEMVQVIRAKWNESGLIPESIYQACKGWDFGQKKVPSPYLTFLCERMLERLQ